MAKTVSLFGEFELTDALMAAACADGSRWQSADDDSFAYRRETTDSKRTVTATYCSPIWFAHETPRTPIANRAELRFTVESECVDDAIQGVGRVLRVTDADAYMLLDNERPLIRYAGELHLFRRPDDTRTWAPQNLEAMPQPHALHLYPSRDLGDEIEVAGDFTLNDALIDATVGDDPGWIRQPSEDEPSRVEYLHRSGASMSAFDDRSLLHPHELGGRTVKQRTTVCFMFDDDRFREESRLCAFKAAMRVVRATRGDLLVRYQDLILMMRQSENLTLFRSMPERDLLGRQDYLDRVPGPHVWERLEPPWYAGLPRIRKSLDAP